MRRWLLLLLALPCLAFAANPRATSLAKDADRLYRDGKYKDAAEALKKAFALEPNPVLLYNMARALDQAGELRASLDAYRDFVGLEGADPQLVKRANLAMDRVRSLLAKQEADSRVRDAEQERLAAEARKERERADQEAEAARRQREEIEAKQRQSESAEVKKFKTLRLASLIAAGGAVVVLGTGVALGASAASSRDGFRQATTVADKQRLEAETRGKAIAADVCLGVALAAAITAVVLFPGLEAPEAQGSVQVTLAPAPGGFQAGLGGRF